VTFNKTVNARSVTLDGVVFDPAGTLTGGSRPQAASLLEQLQRLNGMKDQLAEEKHKLQKLDGDFAKTRESSREYQVRRWWANAFMVGELTRFVFHRN